MEIKNELIVSLVFVFITFAFAIIFSLAEHSFSKLQARDIRWLRVKNDKRSLQILSLLKSRINIVATMEFWKQFFVLSFIFCSTFAIVFLSNDLLSKELSFWLTFLIVFIFTFFFVFLVPKIYADNHVLIVARAVTPYIMPFEKLIAPVAKRTPNVNLSPSMKSEESAHISDQERMLYSRIVDFPSKTIHQILKPRIEIQGLSKNLSFSEVLEKVNKFQHSRLPVYDGSIDKIIGILYAKDLVPFLDQSEFYWQSLLVKPLLVNLDLPLTELLDRFKKYQIHMAIVVDEFGGCLGLVTLEDVIEVVLGDIYDEYDAQEKLVTQKNDHTYVINPKIALSKLIIQDQKFADLFEGYESMKVETLNGFILEEFHKIPDPGDELHLKDARIIIDNTAKNRIESVTITF